MRKTLKHFAPGDVVSYRVSDDIEDGRNGWKFRLGESVNVCLDDRIFNISSDHPCLVLSESFIGEHNSNHSIQLVFVESTIVQWIERADGSEEIWKSY